MSAGTPAPDETLASPARVAAVAKVLAAAPRVRGAMDRWARLLAQLLDAPVAQINLVTDVDQCPIGSEGGADWSTPVELPWSYCRHVVASGSPMIVADTRCDPVLADSLPTTEAGIVAYAASPLTLASGETIGTLCAVDFRPREWSANQVEILGDLSRAVVLELERDIAESALRESESRYRAVQEVSPDGFQLADNVVDSAGRVVDFVYRYLNPAGLRMVNRSEEQMLGRRMLEVFPSLVGSNLFEAYLRVASTGEPMQREVEYQADALDAGFRVTAVRVPGGIALTFHDTTARLRAEQALAEREAEFRALADNIPQLAWMADPSGSIYWYNQRWYEYTGTTLQEMRGWGWQRVHDPELVGPVTERFRRAFAAGQPWEDTFPLRSRNGQFRWFLSRALPLRDEGGRIVRWFGTNTDITEERAIAAERERLLESERSAREALAERTETAEQRQAELSAVLEHLPAAVWITDHNGRVLRVNPGTTALYGGAPLSASQEEYGEYEAYWPADHPRAGRRLAADEWALSRTLRTGKTVINEALQIVRFDDGQRRQVLNSSAAIRDAAGRITGGVVVMIDVTEQEATRRALDDARVAAEEANRSKTDFLATMSHELRTPLNAIAGYVDLILMGIHGPVTEAQTVALGKVQKAQQALLRLINDVLNFVRIEAGSLTYEIEPVCAADVVRDIMPLIEPQAAAQRHALVLRVPDERGQPPVRVLADRDKLKQVLINLLGNAVKFTPPGGTITVDLAGASDDRVEIRVRDTGIGISHDKHATIFDPFVQVDASLTRAHEGIGLGLAISRDLARGMGGDLDVESSPAAGSTFILSLRAVPGADR